MEGQATKRKIITMVTGCGLLFRLSSDHEKFITTTTAIELSLGGCSPYTSTDKTNENKYT